MITYKKEIFKSIYSIVSNFNSYNEEIDERLDVFYFINKKLLLKFVIDKLYKEYSLDLIEIETNTKYFLLCLFEDSNEDDVIKSFLKRTSSFFEKNADLLEPIKLEKKILEYEKTMPKMYSDYAKTMEIESGFIQKLTSRQIFKIEKILETKKPLECP